VLEGSLAVHYQGYFDRLRPMAAACGLHRRGAARRPARGGAAMADPRAADDRRFDPIYFPVNGCKGHLDSVSHATDLPAARACTWPPPTAMLARHDITRDTPTIGVMKGDDGEPNGELHEMSAMALCKSAIAPFFRAAASEAAIERFGAMARQVGVTTIADLGSQVLMNPAALERWQRIVNDDTFPARVALYSMPAMPGGTADFGAAATAVTRLREEAATEKLRFPGVKFVLDGSIQGWTASMNWPGYYTGTDHGQLLTIPEQLVDWLRQIPQAGISVHMHRSGTATIDVRSAR
jgi:hypothetical protein